MVAPFIDRSAAPLDGFHARVPSQARSLGPDERKRLSVQALAGQASVSRLAREQGVSRKFNLKDRGLNPRATFADGGQGLRAGQKAAWEDTPCHGDVFHAERELGRLATYLENRAQGCATAREKLERKMERAKKGKKGQRYALRLGRARQAQVKARSLADDIRTLEQWLRQDVLSLAGPSLKERRDLFDFILEQLREREAACPHRITPVRRALENQREQLLGFVGLLEERFEDIAERYRIPPYLVQALCELEGMDQNRSAYWKREDALCQKLRWRFHEVREAVREAMAETPRASSIVENLNGRLRGYFFLRRHIGPEYLDLLRFFLNHRPFMRSDRPERIGKSPAELLTGKAHAHWLELLGYQRFQRN
jgi:hypothetical protein